MRTNENSLPIRGLGQHIAVNPERSGLVLQADPPGPFMSRLPARTQTRRFQDLTRLEEGAATVPGGGEKSPPEEQTKAKAPRLRQCDIAVIGKVGRL